MDASDDKKQTLIHVHQCSSCGRLCPPEDFSARDSITGLYECPHCHHTEALHVQIVPETDIERRS